MSKQEEKKDEKAKAPEGEMVEIPHEYLIEGVKKAVQEIKTKMSAARAKYGSRYNEKNDYEEFGRRFGYKDPEKIWAEFELVWVKQSKQPASVRKVISAIGNAARNYALQRYVSEHQQEQKQEG